MTSLQIGQSYEIEFRPYKQMEAALAERGGHLQLFIEHSPVALAILDRDMRYLAVSRRWRADYPSAMSRRSVGVTMTCPPEILERWRAIHSRCVAAAVESCEEDPFLRADGRVDCSRWEIRPWLTAMSASRIRGFGCRKRRKGTSAASSFFRKTSQPANKQ